MQGVNGLLTVAACFLHAGIGADRGSRMDRVADLTRGGGPYACLRSSGLPGRPISPMRAAARVPLSNLPRPREFGPVAARGILCFRASRPALARPERSSSESDGQGAVAAARAARRAALKPYRKFWPGRGLIECQAPLDMRHRGFT